MISPFEERIAGREEPSRLHIDVIVVAVENLFSAIRARIGCCTEKHGEINRDPLALPTPPPRALVPRPLMHAETLVFGLSFFRARCLRSPAMMEILVRRDKSEDTRRRFGKVRAALFYLTSTALR